MTIIETFTNPERYWLRQLKNKEPSCFNGIVSVKKYRVTVEEIEEPKEVIAERLRKLWEECRNHRHWGPLKEAAKELGINLEHRLTK